MVFLKLVKLFRAAPMMADAQFAVTSGDYKHALLRIEEMARLLGEPVPSQRLPLRVNVLTLQSAYFLDNSSLALQCGKSILDQIRKGRTSAKLSYTADYVVGLMEHCAGRFLSEEKQFLQIADELEPFGGHYDLDEISPLMRDRMPLPRP